MMYRAEAADFPPTATAETLQSQVCVFITASECRQQCARVQGEEEVRERQAQEEADRQKAADKAQADASRRQKDAAHNDAVAAFQTLLAETVKDPSARWQVISLPAFAQPV